VLTRTERYLREKGVDSPRLEAELLISHVLGIERLQIYLKFDRPMSDDELERLRPLVARRGKREPMAWILGSVGFHAIDLAVGPGHEWVGRRGLRRQARGGVRRVRGEGSHVPRVGRRPADLQLLVHALGLERACATWRHGYRVPGRRFCNEGFDR